MRTTFSVWLEKQTHRDDSIGDLARDTFGGPPCPAGDWDVLRDHIENEHPGAIPEVFDTIDRARDEFLRNHPA